MRYKKGFTLIEVLIFTSLISFIFITLSYLAVNSIYNSKVSNHKVLATHHGEELLEWLRGQKEADWESIPTSGIYCFNTSPLTCSTSVSGCASSADNCGASFTLGTVPDKIFKRYVQFLTPVGSERKIVNIKVEWNEGRSDNFSVPINTVFEQYE